MGAKRKIQDGKLFTAQEEAAIAARKAQRELDEKVVRTALEVRFDDVEQELHKQEQEYMQSAESCALAAVIEERHNQTGDSGGQSRERYGAIEGLAKSEATRLAILELRKLHSDITAELVKANVLSADALDKFKKLDERFLRRRTT